MSFMDTGDGGGNRGYRGRGRNQRSFYNNSRNFGRQGPQDTYHQQGRGGGRGGGFNQSNQSYSNWEGGNGYNSSYQGRSGGFSDSRGRGGARTWGRNQGARMAAYEIEHQPFEATCESVKVSTAVSGHKKSTSASSLRLRLYTAVQFRSTDIGFQLSLFFVQEDADAVGRVPLSRKTSSSLGFSTMGRSR